MQYSQEHLKTMVYADFGGQTECIMGNWKIENVIPPNMKEFSILMQIKLILTWTFFTHCLVLRAMSDDFWNLEITH